MDAAPQWQSNGKLKDLAARIGITEVNLSLLKQGRVKGVRFETLTAICAALQCQPGDLLEFRTANESGTLG